MQRVNIAYVHLQMYRCRFGGDLSIRKPERKGFCLLFRKKSVHSLEVLILGNLCCNGSRMMIPICNSSLGNH
jgi:hypothetical protein